MNLYIGVFGLIPSIGWMMPGRNMYAPLNPIFISAFSVLPFTRAHICRPFSVESVEAPDTYTNVIDGFIGSNVSATEVVRSYVSFVYSSSDLPTAVVPRQKKHAS